jgi:hypothetical protein
LRLVLSISFLFRSFKLQDIARLAVEHIADGVKRRKPDGTNLASLEKRSHLYLDTAAQLLGK